MEAPSQMLENFVFSTEVMSSACLLIVTFLAAAAHDVWLVDGEETHAAPGCVLARPDGSLNDGLQMK